MKKHVLYLTAFMTLTLESFCFIIAYHGDDQGAVGFGVMAIVVALLGGILTYCID